MRRITTAGPVLLPALFVVACGAPDSPSGTEAGQGGAAAGGSAVAATVEPPAYVGQRGRQPGRVRCGPPRAHRRRGVRFGGAPGYAAGELVDGEEHDCHPDRPPHPDGPPRTVAARARAGVAELAGRSARRDPDRRPAPHVQRPPLHQLGGDPGADGAVVRGRTVGPLARVRGPDGRVQVLDEPRGRVSAQHRRPLPQLGPVDAGLHRQAHGRERARRGVPVVASAGARTAETANSKPWGWR